MPLGECDRVGPCIWEGIQGQAEECQPVPLRISMNIGKNGEVQVIQIIRVVKM